MSGFVVRFVLVENSNQEAIHEACKAVQTAGLATDRISEAAVHQITQKDSSLYVCDPFEGTAFEHLLKHKCRIIGPQCVLSCLQVDVPIPKTSHPVYNICLKGVEISCSSIDKDEREQVHRLVEWMGGRVSRSFTETVTHLIAGEVGSKKYFVAADLDKPIMLPDWIHTCWKRSQGRHFHGTSDEIIKEFTCPVFKGCIICVTGLDSDERKDVKRLVDDYGGRYTGELKFKECTHLIVNVSGPKGQKYEFAKKWKIPCVTIKWFYDSVAKGSCQNEDLYKVDGGNKQQQQPENRSSTPKEERDKARPRMSNFADCSVISVSTVNETGMTTAYESMIAPQIGGIAEKNDTSMEELDALDVSDYEGDLFLDGYKILLSGFSGNRLEKLRKIINTGGGTRFNQLNASVSHVIIGEKVQEHYDLLLQGKFRPAVVSAQWLMDSFKQGIHVDENRYSVLDLQHMQTVSPQVKSKLSKTVDGSCNDTTILEGADKTIAEEHMDDDVMAMYMDNKTNPDMTTDGNQTTDSEITFNPPKTNENQQQDGTRLEQQEMDITACIPQEAVGIFAGKSFIIMGFPPEQESQIEEMIRLQQGDVHKANNRIMADYAVVPVTGCPVKTTVSEVTTNCWLQMCIETEECLNPASNALFSPIVLNQDAMPLQGCVLSISQYAGVERDCVLHLAELLGATCQEYFVRKANAPLKANTHLLLKEADGSKYKAAKKWKIPTVTKEWLLECAKTGKKQPEENFPIDAQQSVTTSAPNVQSRATSETSSSKELSKENCVEFKQPELPSVAKRTPVRTSDETRKDDVKVGIPAAGAAAVQETRTSDETRKDDVKVEIPDVGVASVEETRTNRPSGSKNEVVNSIELPRIQQNTESATSNHNNSPLPSKSKTGLDDLKENVIYTPATARAVKATNKLLAGLRAGEGVDTPNKFLGDISFRPSFDLDDVNAFLESPAGVQHRNSAFRRRSSLPLDDLLSANLAKAVANMADADQGEMESQSQDDSVFQEKPPGVLDGVVICVCKKLSKKQGHYNKIAASLGADYKWLYDETCTHFVFQGRANDMAKEFKVAKEQGKIIVSPHWLAACEEQNVHVDESLYPHTYNPKLTLPVTSSRTPARTPARPTTSRATRQSARKVTQPLAKPAQISPPPQPELAQDGFENKDSTDSDEEMMRITEAAEERQDGDEGDKVAKVSPPNNEEEGRKVAKVSPPQAEEDGSLEMRENFQKQFEEIMTSTLSANSKRRRSRRPMSSTSNLSGAEMEGASGSGRRARSKRGTLADTSEDQEVAQKIGSSQSVQITWDDPTSRKEREKIMAQLNEENPEHQESVAVRRTPRKSVRLNENKEISNPAPTEEDSPPTPTPMAPPIRLPVSKPPVAAPQQSTERQQELQQPQQRNPPKFLLSGMSSDEKVDYGAVIEKLGGEVKDAQYFDPSCTHIVVGNPTRNEKYLASLASGKWVLHKSYLEACREQETFVQEEDHEWGNATDLNSVPAQTAKLAMAATRWRQKLDEERKKSNYQIIPGAFDGWSVLLHVDRARESGFKRLLQAGGAKIIGMRPPFPDFENATHGFFDFSKAKSSGGSVDLEAIVSAGVLCLKPEYIAQYLMEDPLPDPANYCISEVKAILERLNTNTFSESRNTTIATPTPTKRKRQSTMGSSRNKKAKR